MNEILYYYNPVDPATWYYLSSLLMIGLFFKFSRFWSVRNLDLVLLMLLAPGLLFVHYGKQISRKEHEAAMSIAEESMSGESGVGIRDPSLPVDAETGESDPLATTGSERPPEVSEAADLEEEGGLPRGLRAEKFGYLWLFCCAGLWLARLLADPTMVRRPLLEPNLSAGGLTFIGCSLFVFLMANVINRPIEAPITAPVVPSIVAGESSDNEDSADSKIVREGPGYVLMDKLSTTQRKVLAILGHLMIVLGIVLIGYRHFDNIVMGVGAATLYLMLPYTAIMTNEVKHVLPSASLVWAVLWYRKPLTAGVFLGLAGGMTYYPLFLLPLWLSFYWPRGLLRFVIGVTSILVVLAFVLVSSNDVFSNLRLMFGLFPPAMDGLRGVWDETVNGWSTYYRIPVLTAFIALAGSMALWPAQKNLGTLLSCSTAVMVATQTWHGYGGGTYMAWYLPLLLLTIFRPNLEDRVALTVLGAGWLPRRLSALPNDRGAVAASTGLRPARGEAVPSAGIRR